MPNGHYQIGQNAFPNNGFPAGVTLYRDPTFELSFSRQFDTNKRMTRRFDRTGLAIDTTTAPSTPTFWSNQDSWSVFTPGRVPTFISSTEPGGGGDSANFSQDAFFDATFDDGFWGGSDARMNETFTRDTAGRVTQVCSPSRYRRRGLCRLALQTSPKRSRPPPRRKRRIQSARSPTSCPSANPRPRDARNRRHVERVLR